MDKQAVIRTVKNKVDSLRSSFRKEMKKIRDSRRSGSESDAIYEPHLWYFENLKFLIDQETPRDSISNLDTDQDSIEMVSKLLSKVLEVS